MTVFLRCYLKMLQLNISDISGTDGVAADLAMVTLLTLMRILVLVDVEVAADW